MESCRMNRVWSDAEQRAAHIWSAHLLGVGRNTTHDIRDRETSHMLSERLTLNSYSCPYIDIAMAVCFGANGRCGRETYFFVFNFITTVCVCMCIWVCVCLCMCECEHQKNRLQTQTQNQLEFSIKCSVTKILSTLVPFLTHCQFRQSHEMQCDICYFSQLRASNSNRLEIEYSMVYCTMLENEANANVCVHLPKHFVSLALLWAFWSTTQTKNDFHTRFSETSSFFDHHLMKINVHAYAKITIENNHNYF